MRTFAIGEICEKTGLTRRTLHHYEDIGLISPERSHADYRLYSETDITKLYRITALKTLGFSLSDIRDVDRLPIDETQKIFVTHLDHLQSQHRQNLASVRALKTFINEKISLDELLSVIKREEFKLHPKNREAYFEEHYSAKERDSWGQGRELLDRIFGDGVYDDHWRELYARILDALPLSPRSEAARQFVREWSVLAAPLLQLMGPAQLQKSADLLTQSNGRKDVGPFDVPREVWEFIVKAAEVHNDVNIFSGKVP